MTKLPHLNAARCQIVVANSYTKTAACMAHLDEILRAIDVAIALEHDAHLREIRRLGT